MQFGFVFTGTRSSPFTNPQIHASQINPCFTKQKESIQHVWYNNRTKKKYSIAVYDQLYRQVIDNRARRWLFTYEPFPAIEISLRKQLQEEDSKWIVTHRVRIFLP